MPTVFQSKVYSACSQIPEGCFSTYAEMSKALRSSPRAVGQALKRNPYAPTVPCHRVIASDFTLGGYSGKLHCQKKVDYLLKEGIHFEGGKVIKADQQKVFTSKQFKMDTLEQVSTSAV
ncbi:6-O-methylguanine DNA methyltransferase [Globomyces pollinis-pini]|nr:6-O-methylguanine DNA methyltransferase [Globomyces pollinis-pini]KAJ2991630.1 hypothetical protein HDV02_003656 [Globomyces sp. JEL0801]